MTTPEFNEQCRRVAIEHGTALEGTVAPKICHAAGMAQGPKRTFPTGHAFVYDDEWMTIVASVQSPALVVTRKDLTSFFPDHPHLRPHNPMIYVQDDGSLLRTHGEWYHLREHVIEILGEEPV